MAFVLLTGGKGSALPPPPTREELMWKRWHFQGLRVPVDNLTGWFEPALAWIDRSKRASVYSVKDAAGDQLYGISLSGAYREINQPYEQYAGYDFTKDLPGLNSLIDEILTGGPGRAIRLFCAGDGQGSGPNYNNTDGLTYGCDWLLNYTPTLIEALGDRWRYC